MNRIDILAYSIGGGELTIAPREGGGTSVRVTIPEKNQ